MFPRGGSMFSLDIAVTPPYSKWNNLNYETAAPEEKYKWAEYHKWMFDAKFYTKIIGDLVLESRAHLGYIGSFSGEDKIGPFERFYLGGDGWKIPIWFIYEIITCYPLLIFILSR